MTRLWSDGKDSAVVESTNSGSGRSVERNGDKGSAKTLRRAKARSKWFDVLRQTLETIGRGTRTLSVAALAAIRNLRKDSRAGYMTGWSCDLSMRMIALFCALVRNASDQTWLVGTPIGCTYKASEPQPSWFQREKVPLLDRAWEEMCKLRVDNYTLALRDWSKYTSNSRIDNTNHTRDLEQNWKAIVQVDRGKNTIMPLSDGQGGKIEQTTVETGKTKTWNCAGTCPSPKPVCRIEFIWSTGISSRSICFSGIDLNSFRWDSRSC